MSGADGAGAQAAPVTEPNSDQMRLPDHYAAAVALTAELSKLPATSAEYKAKQEEVLEHFEAVARMVDELRVFSSNEHYSEHSTESLRYLAAFAERAEMHSRRYPAIDDKDRDAKRIEILTSAKAMFRDFLDRCLSLGLGEGAPDELAQGERPSREAKVEQVREQMELDKKLKQLAAELAEVTKGGKEPDEDLVRSHTLAALEAWVAKAKGQLWSLTSEEQMLVQMQAHRRAHPEAASGGEADTRQKRPPAQPPTVITKAMVENMVRTGEPINRADFKLVTRGYGPIGAPTMSLQQLADKEMAEAMRRSQEAAQAAAEKELIDPDSEEAVDAETYRERRKDEEYRDHTRRGDGNRYNQG